MVNQHTKNMCESYHWNRDIVLDGHVKAHLRVHVIRGQHRQHLHQELGQQFAQSFDENRSSMNLFT